jgi:phosphoenolpyruvate synthase/pyruvate phosphate dikinase
LSEGKITLDEYNRKKDDLEKQISNCDVKLADKQQKLEQKMTELQDIKDKVNFYDVTYVRFDVPEIKVRPPMYAAKNSILGERKFRLLNQRERDAIGEELQSIKYLRHQQIHESLSLIFLTKNHKYCRLSLCSSDSLQLFLYLCSKNLANL